jgi:ABC-type ATPase with predicted acetyltransferase domain
VRRAAGDLAEAQHEKTNLARAIAERGGLDALLSALDEATNPISRDERDCDEGRVAPTG